MTQLFKTESHGFDYMNYLYSLCCIEGNSQVLPQRHKGFYAMVLLTSKKYNLKPEEISYESLKDIIENEPNEKTDKNVDLIFKELNVVFISIYYRNWKKH